MQNKVMRKSQSDKEMKLINIKEEIIQHKLKKPLDPEARVKVEENKLKANIIKEENATR
jgi:hypothetical protein